MRLHPDSGSVSLSCGDACVDGLAKREKHPPVGARALDDGDEKSAPELAVVALRGVREECWRAVWDSNPRLPD